MLGVMKLMSSIAIDAIKVVAPIVVCKDTDADNGIAQNAWKKLLPYWVRPEEL